MHTATLTLATALITLFLLIITIVLGGIAQPAYNTTMGIMIRDTAPAPRDKLCEKQYIQHDNIPGNLAENIVIKPLLRNFSVVSGLREYTVSISGATYIAIYLNHTKLTDTYGSQLSFILNTTMYRDGVYLLNISYIVSNLSHHICIYIIIDNTPPDTRIDVMGIPSGENNTVIPVHDKHNPNIRYVLHNSTGIYFKAYLYAEDPNLAYILLYINNTLYANLTPTEPRVKYIRVNSDGIYVLKLYAVDRGGNIGRYILAIRVDTTPPHIIINAPRIVTKPGYIRINATIYDYPNSTITTLALLGKNAVLPTDNVSGPSPLKVSASIKIENTTSDTVFNISFHAIDEALNYVYNYTLITIDLNPPIIHVNITNQSNNYILNTYVTDNGTGIKNITIYMNNKIIYMNNKYNKTIYIQINITKYLINKNNTIYIITYDNISHKSIYRTYILINMHSNNQIHENQSENNIIKQNNQSENTFIIVIISIVIVLVIYYVKRRKSI